MRILAVAAAVLLLAGCVPVADPVEPTPSPSVTPVFASEEEALAAAEEAYAAYQAAVDQALATYEIESLETVATGEALAEAVESVHSFQSQGRRLVGASIVRTVELIQGGDMTSVPGELFQTYSCLDISRTDVLDISGDSTVLPERITLIPMQVSFAWIPEKLIVTAVDVWGGDDFCR